MFKVWNIQYIFHQRKFSGQRSSWQEANGGTTESFRFLPVGTTNSLKRVNKMTIILKKAHQRLFLLQQLMKLSVPQLSLNIFYSAIIDIVLTTFIRVWFLSASSICKTRLQRRWSSAVNLPKSRTIKIQKRKRIVVKIAANTKYPSNQTSITSRTKHHQNSFFPEVI